MTTRQSNAGPRKIKLGEPTTKEAQFRCDPSRPHMANTQTSFAYIEVHREWDDKVAASSPVRETTACSTQPIMLKTWLEGRMREDPYQAIGAVGVSHSPDQGVAGQDGDTSDAVASR